MIEGIRDLRRTALLHTRRCPTCQGKAVLIKSCEKCHGSGLGIFSACNNCLGKGKEETRCPDCLGRGFIILMANQSRISDSQLTPGKVDR